MALLDYKEISKDEKEEKEFNALASIIEDTDVPIKKLEEPVYYQEEFVGKDEVVDEVKPKEPTPEQTAEKEVLDVLENIEVPDELNDQIALAALVVEANIWNALDAAQNDLDASTENDWSQEQLAIILPPTKKLVQFAFDRVIKYFIRLFKLKSDSSDNIFIEWAIVYFLLRQKQIRKYLVPKLAKPKQTRVIDNPKQKALPNNEGLNIQTNTANAVKSDVPGTKMSDEEES